MEDELDLENVAKDFGKGSYRLQVELIVVKLKAWRRCREIRVLFCCRLDGNGECRGKDQMCEESPHQR